MMSKFSARFSLLVGAGVFAGLAACTSEVSDGAPPSTTEIASLESELAIAQGSFGVALDDVKACFEDFKDCRASAASGADCVDALKECLPELPGLAGGASGAPGAPGGFFGLGGGMLPLPGSGQPGRAPGSGFGGIAASVDPAALAACTDDLRAAGGQDPAALGAAFQDCIGDVFAELIADVCERIADACDGAADSKICERLAEACADPALTP